MIAMAVIIPFDCFVDQLEKLYFLQHQFMSDEKD